MKKNTTTQTQDGNRKERRTRESLERKGKLVPIYPVMIARQKLPDYFPGRTARTWANLAHMGLGPKYFRKGKTCWYLTDDVIADLMQNPINGTGG